MGQHQLLVNNTWDPGDKESGMGKRILRMVVKGDPGRMVYQAQKASRMEGPRRDFFKNITSVEYLI